jgi:Flp pilus assembly protein TadD
MALVLRRGVVCILLPHLGCSAAPDIPADPAPTGEAAAPGTWAEGLDGLVFGDDDSAAGGSSVASSPGKESSGGDLERTAALAVEAVREDRLEDAAPLLEEAVAMAPAGERWRYERALADTFLALGRSVEAALLYQGLIEAGTHGSHDSARGDSAPAVAETTANLAAAYYRLGDAALARASATAALEARPGNPEALKTLGLAEILDGDLDRGVETLREALRADPAIPEALLALAEIDEARGDRAAALERYRKLLDLSAAAEAEGRDPGRRIRGLFLFRPMTAPGTAPPLETSRELEARIQRLEGRREGS